MHEAAEAREDVLARHDPRHEGDERHDPQRIHAQLGVALDVLEASGACVCVHGKANRTGEHEDAQHELQRERMVVDEVGGMGYETTRTDGGQGKPEAIHDRIDGM